MSVIIEYRYEKKINLKEDKTEVDRDIEKMLEDPEAKKIYEKMAPIWEKEFDGMAQRFSCVPLSDFSQAVFSPGINLILAYFFKRPATLSTG